MGRAPSTASTARNLSVCSSPERTLFVADVNLFTESVAADISLWAFLNGILCIGLLLHN